MCWGEFWDEEFGGDGPCRMPENTWFDVLKAWYAYGREEPVSSVSSSVSSLRRSKICDKMRPVRGQNGVLADIYKGLNREKKDLSATLDWKARDLKKVAILIDGARRVGKSWVAEEFGKNEYESYLLIDFRLAGPEVWEMFETQLDGLRARLGVFLKLHLKNTPALR